MFEVEWKMFTNDTKILSIELILSYVRLPFKRNLHSKTN